MKRALLVSTGLLLAVTTVAACVDLFHDTDSLFADAGDVIASDADPPDASAPRGLVCTGSIQALATAETACAWLGACALPFGVNEPGGCMVQALRAYDCTFDPSNVPRAERAEFWACLQTASEARSCGAVRTCVMPGLLGLQTCQADNNDFFVCLGDRPMRSRVFCRDSDGGNVPFTGAENCAAAGGTCITRGGRPACSTAADPLGLGSACSRSTCQSPTSLSICEGNEATGIEVAQVDCTQGGSGTCGSGTDAGPGCVAASAATGNSCSPDTEVRCNGATATRCRNSVAEEVACGNVGLGCEADGAVFTYEGCQAAAPRDAGEDAEAGDGGPCKPGCTSEGDVVACMNGLAVVVECSAKGLGRCVPQTSLGEPDAFGCQAPGAEAGAD